MKTMKIITLFLALTLSALAQPNENQSRTVVVSNQTYLIQYHLKNPAHSWVPAIVGPTQPHYDCVATVWLIGGSSPLVIGSPIDTQWTEKGCFEDSPMLVIGAALKWERYPNNSAGDGMHWRIRGGAMFTESDKEFP